MSVTTATKTSVTVNPRGYPEYDRHYSQRISTESRRRIGIQDLINEPVRSEQFHNYQRRPELGLNQFNRYSLSPPYLPLPLPQQHKQHYLMPTTPFMALYSYRLPTSLMSPTSTPVTSPSVAPIQSYSSSSSTASTSPIMSKSDDQNSYMTAILSLHERREKNKIASAKYRAKKQRQNQEMSTTIAELSAEKDVFLRQLEEVKAENLELKELVDKLKSKLVEGRILKRLGKGGAKLSISPTSTVNDSEITSNSNISTTIRKHQTKRGGSSGHAKGTGPSIKGCSQVN